MRSNKIVRGIVTAVIVLVAAVVLGGGIVYMAFKLQPEDNVDIPIDQTIDNPVQQTPAPTTKPDVEQEIVIDQDRTLKFDNLIKGTVGVNSGVATVTVDEYADSVDGMVIINRVKKYEETEGFNCTNTEMFRVESTSGCVSSEIDSTKLYIDEFYDTTMIYDSFIVNRLGSIANVFEHQSEWKLPFKDYTSGDVPTETPDWAVYDDGSHIVTGVGYLDFTAMGYESAFTYQMYSSLTQSYVTVCYLKVSDNRIIMIKCDGNPINQIGYITELVQNSLVVF